MREKWNWQLLSLRGGARVSAFRFEMSNGQIYNNVYVYKFYLGRGGIVATYKHHQRHSATPFFSSPCPKLVVQYNMGLAFGAAFMDRSGCGGPSPVRASISRALLIVGADDLCRCRNSEQPLLRGTNWDGHQWTRQWPPKLVFLFAKRLSNGCGFFVCCFYCWCS